jgi:RNA polymerase sigma-70 factor (sigma-E family)
MSGIGDDEFRAAFDRSFPVAQRLARRITGDAGLSEDIAAEAFTRLYARWWRLSRTDYVDAWIFRVTTNLALGAIRRRERPLTASGWAGGVDEEIAIRLTLADALRRLPCRQREVVVLRYLSDLSEADVAAVLGVTAGSVKTHVHRGLARLCSLLEAADDRDVEVRLARQR